MKLFDEFSVCMKLAVCCIAVLENITYCFLLILYLPLHSMIYFCKHAPLNTNNEIQDNAKESYYVHNKTHITLNVHIIRK